MQDALPGPEFKLLRDCCRACFDKGEGKNSSLPAKVDWDLFLRLVVRHRVEGLVHKGLGHVDGAPERVREALAGNAREIAAENLIAVSDSARLRNAFADAGLPLLFLKGLPLARLAYGDPFYKRAIDIDLLVRPDDVAASAALLSRLGYTPIIPADVAAVPRWHYRSKESNWSRPAGRPVDLHSRLADSAALLSFDPAANAETVEVTAEVSVPSLAGDQLLAYLAVHGGSSAWFRLKWLSDFAALLEGRTQVEIERAYLACAELAGHRAAGSAFSLAGEVFGVPLSDSLRERLKQDRRIRVLVALSKRKLFDLREPTEKRFGTAAIHLSQLLMTEPAMRVREVRRQIALALASRRFKGG